MNNQCVCLCHVTTNNLTIMVVSRPVSVSVSVSRVVVSVSVLVSKVPDPVSLTSLSDGHCKCSGQI